MLNVPHGMGYPARMPVVPNRNEFFALQKTRSQKCTRMYIFDEVVAVGFNTLCYDAERRGIKPSVRINKKGNLQRTAANYRQTFCNPIFL